MNPSDVLSQFGLTQGVMTYVMTFGLMMMRILTAITVIPFLGGRSMPGRFRISLALALVIFLFPIVQAQIPNPVPDSYFLIGALFLKETLFGFLLGLVMGMVFYGVQAAGAMVDNQRQLANAQIFNPGIGAQATIFGVFYYEFAVVIFILVQGHIFFFKGLIESFAVVPIYQLPDWMAGTAALPRLTDLPVIKLVVRLSAETLLIAVQMSAPVLIAIFIADLILGLTNRIAPMVNVFEMGFNIKGWVGAALVWLSLPVIYVQLKELFKHALGGFNQVVQWFLAG
ncbi:MAG: flagellar biosynthetic protein FliR [Deltaproteobacteria bacterium]|nr:flagellar biosynthetic protein FliR [Deltaproteobacteria bacterium]